MHRLGEDAPQALQFVPYFRQLVAKPPDAPQLSPPQPVLARGMGTASFVCTEYVRCETVQIAGRMLEQICDAIANFFAQKNEDLEAVAGCFLSIGKPFRNLVECRQHDKSDGDQVVLRKHKAHRKFRVTALGWRAADGVLR